MPGLGNDDGVLDPVAEMLIICGPVVLATAAGAALREIKDGEGRRVDGKGERGRRVGEEARELVRERGNKAAFGEKFVVVGAVGFDVGDDMYALY